jgi:integrase
MAKPGELAALSAELKTQINPCPFSFEWSSPSQGKRLILCGDWNRQGKRTSRTLQDRNCQPIQKGPRQLSTEQRLTALEAAGRLVKSYLEGSAAKQRKKPPLEPSSNLLEQQRRCLVQWIRERDGGYGAKRKHLRHAWGLFDWLETRNCLLDSATSISWASDGIERNTDNYADRLRIAQWACQINGISWILPPSKRAKKPDVKRPFVEAMVDVDLSGLFELVQDPEAQAFMRVIAATGCRPSEVLCFDWKTWDEAGRPNHIDGYSRKQRRQFTSLIHPLEWLKDLDISLVTGRWSQEQLERDDEVIASALTKHYSRLLKLMQQDLRSTGLEHLPSWTCLRHLWTIRAEVDGIDRRIGALSQAHSVKMASLVYLRHGQKAQVLAEAKRLDRVELPAC